MIYISDKTLLKVVSDLDTAKLTKNNYRNILVDLGLYSLEEADELSSAYNKGKKEFIRITLQDLDWVNLRSVLRDLKGYLSNETLNALSMDGIEVQQSLTGKYAEPAQEISFLEKSLRTHSLQSVQDFLDQSLDSFSQENYEAANAMTRTALEDFVKHIALKISGLRGQEAIPIKNNRYDYPQPSDYRNYLKQTKFLDESESEFLNKFYGYSSTDGSHPGTSTQSDARLRRFVVTSILLLFIEKIENDTFMSKLS